MNAKTAEVPSTLFSSDETAADTTARPAEVVLEPAPFLTKEDLPPVLGRQPVMLEPARLWTITPDMSRCLLDEHDKTVERYNVEGRQRDGHNRSIRMADVSTYAADMKAGRWARNGTTVSRTWDGLWQDGQHRLMACMQAMRGFETFVIFGVDLKTQDTVDTGIKRKVQDQLNLSGEPNATNLAAISRWAWRWLRGARTRSGYAVPNPSQLELIGFIESDERLRIATSWAVRAYPQFRQVRVSVYGIAWLLFYGTDHLSAQVFLDAVTTGADIGLNHPAMAFRNRMLQAGTGRDREKLNEHQQLALLIMAWNAFRSERTLTRLQLPAGGLKPSNFPEPR